MLQYFPLRNIILRSHWMVAKGAGEDDWRSIAATESPCSTAPLGTVPVMDYIYGNRLTLGLPRKTGGCPKTTMARPTSSR